MEILQVYAYLYVEKFKNLQTFLDWLKHHDDLRSLGDEDKHRLEVLIGELEILAGMCQQGDLPVTAIAINSALATLKHEKQSNTTAVLKIFISDAMARLPDELSTKLFFELPHSRKEFFEKPTSKWEAVIKRFPESMGDIEEASKCFALSRYGACVFHCVQVIEHGLVRLGTFLSVNDPISGWTAVANRMKKILDKKYDERTPFEKQHFPFIEQMQGTVEALKNAWRNKISHVNGQRLVLVSSEFTPDVAEEILTATRSFMRRLAEQLPNPDKLSEAPK